MGSETVAQTNICMLQRTKNITFYWKLKSNETLIRLQFEVTQVVPSARELTMALITWYLKQNWELILTSHAIDHR